MKMRHQLQTGSLRDVSPAAGDRVEGDTRARVGCRQDVGNLVWNAGTAEQLTASLINSRLKRCLCMSGQIWGIRVVSSSNSDMSVMEQVVQTWGKWSHL